MYFIWQNPFTGPKHVNGQLQSEIQEIPIASLRLEN